MTSIEKLKAEILSFLNVSPEKTKINLNDSLLESGLLDSLNIIDLTMHLEKIYKVEFTTEDMTRSNFETIDAISKLLFQQKVPVKNDNADNP